MATVLETIINEAQNEGLEGMVAVANVIRNRADARGLTPEQVVNEKGQFDPMRADARRPTPQQKAWAEQAWEGVQTGSVPDNTGGATFFHGKGLSKSDLGTPGLQYATKVGNQTFYTHPSESVSVRTASASASRFMSHPEAMAFLEDRAPGENAAMLDRSMAVQLATAMRDAEKATGERATSTDLYRDPRRQAQYYANYKQRPVEWEGQAYYPQGGGGGLAAAPGRSNHQKGMAADIPRGKVRDWVQEHAGDYGLGFLSGHAFVIDPVHVNFKSDVTGGVGGIMPPVVPMPRARGVSNTQYPQWDLPPVPGIQPVQSAAAAPASPSYDFASRVPEQFRDQAAERDAMLNGTSPPSSAAAPLTLAQRSEQAKAAVSGLTEAPQAPRLPYGSAPFPGIQPIAAPRTSAPVSPGVMAGMSYPSSPPSASVPAAPQLGNPSYTGAPNQNPYAPTQYKTVTTEPGYWKTIDIPGGPQLGNPDYKGGPNENPYAPTTIPAVPPVSAPTTKKVWVEPVTKRVPIPMPRFNPRRAATPAPQPQRGGWGALWTGIPKVLDGLGMLGGGRLGNLGNLGFSSVNVNMAPTYTATGGGKAAAPSPSGGPNYDYTTGLMSNGQFAGQYENNAGTSITYVQNEDGSYSHIYG